MISYLGGLGSQQHRCEGRSRWKQSGRYIPITPAVVSSAIFRKGVKFRSCRIAGYGNICVSLEGFNVVGVVP